MEARFKIGQQFTNRKDQLCTITDIFKTYNHAGDLVKIRYAVSHNFLNQTITDYDVVDPTIAKAIFKENPEYFIELTS